jgi:hypothetical protein
MASKTKPDEAQKEERRRRHPVMSALRHPLKTVAGIGVFATTGVTGFHNFSGAVKRHVQSIAPIMNITKTPTLPVKEIPVPWALRYSTASSVPSRFVGSVRVPAAENPAYISDRSGQLNTTMAKQLDEVKKTIDSHFKKWRVDVPAERFEWPAEVYLPTPTSKLDEAKQRAKELVQAADLALQTWEERNTGWDLAKLPGPGAHKLQHLEKALQGTSYTEFIGDGAAVSAATITTFACAMFCPSWTAGFVAALSTGGVGMGGYGLYAASSPGWSPAVQLIESAEQCVASSLYAEALNLPREADINCLVVPSDVDVAAQNMFVQIAFNGYGYDGEGVQNALNGVDVLLKRDLRDYELAQVVAMHYSRRDPLYQGRKHWVFGEVNKLLASSENSNEHRAILTQLSQAIVVLVHLDLTRQSFAKLDVLIQEFDNRENDLKKRANEGWQDAVRKRAANKVWKLQQAIAASLSSDDLTQDYVGLDASFQLWSKQCDDNNELSHCWLPKLVLACNRVMGKTVQVVGGAVGSMAGPANIVSKVLENATIQIIVGSVSITFCLVVAFCAVFRIGIGSVLEYLEMKMRAMAQGNAIKAYVKTYNEKLGHIRRTLLDVRQRKTIDPATAMAMLESKLELQGLKGCIDTMQTLYEGFKVEVNVLKEAQAQGLAPENGSEKMTRFFLRRMTMWCTDKVATLVENILGAKHQIEVSEFPIVEELSPEEKKDLAIFVNAQDPEYFAQAKELCKQKQNDAWEAVRTATSIVANTVSVDEKDRVRILKNLVDSTVDLSIACSRYSAISGIIVASNPFQFNMVDLMTCLQNLQSSSRSDTMEVAIQTLQKSMTFTQPATASEDAIRERFHHPAASETPIRSRLQRLTASFAPSASPT